jgi:aspartate 1-decarboxylase
VLRVLLKSKLHRATVTHADLDYEGSCTIDRDLMMAADILPYEQVHLWNVSRGTRLVTYALEGASGSGIICVNGAAAHLNKPGDILIIATFAEIDDQAAAAFRPRIVLVDERNRVRQCGVDEVPGPAVRKT